MYGFHIKVVWDNNLLENDECYGMSDRDIKKIFLQTPHTNYDISQVEEKFGREAVEGHRTRPDGSDRKWKQIGVTEISDSHELPFLFNG
jgi:hypothetical protein